MAEPARNLDQRIRIQGDPDIGTPEISIGAAATDKVGFHGANPIAQRADAAQAALVAYSAGANGLANAAEVQALVEQVQEIRTTLVNLGLWKGSA